jgi:uncharacterized repeat protein (TIGR01451 family)
MLTLKRKPAWLISIMLVLAVTLLAFSPAQSLAGDLASGPNLLESKKLASQSTLAPGETLIYTILLKNTGDEGTEADVSDVVPRELSFVEGSITGGGEYHSLRGVITWDDVRVPAGEEVELTFQVRPAISVTEPTVVRNIASIGGGNAYFNRLAWIHLVPGGTTEGPDLSYSYKSASQPTLSPDETLTFAIHLHNSGDVAASADVSDPVPAALAYVAGSANEGGVYDSGTKTVTWENVNVPAGATVDLSFQVRPAETVETPVVVKNVARISWDSRRIEREASIVLVPQRPDIGAILAGSYKTASRRALAPDETLTYTIYLHNSGTYSATVDVTDPVPDMLAYVAGSANEGGAYDPATETISWSGVTVMAGEKVELTFQVIPAVSVTEPTPVVNAATIESQGRSFVRRAGVLLVPETAATDPLPPVVRSVTIGDQDVLTDPRVALHIDATDNVGVTRMYIREWQLVSAPWPHWEIVQESDWVKFQADVEWSLHEESGTHYITVVVSDAAHNRSHHHRRAMDFASLVLPGEMVEYLGMTPYLVYFPAGVEVNADLITGQGDADLYVWYPGNPLHPDQKSTNPGTELDSVTFTTPRAGIYLILVHGASASTFDLTITPGGGPRAWLVYEGLANGALLPLSDDGSGNLFYEPILSQSGIDPLAVAVEPPDKYKVFSPVMIAP